MDERPWVRIELEDAAGTYTGELVARLSDCIVVNVLCGEHAFEGTHVFPTSAVAREGTPNYPAILSSPKLGWDTRERCVPGNSLAQILQNRPIDRLLLVEILGDSEVCWIGFSGVDGDDVVLEEVTPNGERTVTERYPIDQLARVAWGGGYLLALEERERPGTMAVEHFVAAVRRFVEVIEGGAELSALQRVLAELQMRALDLPDWDSDGGDGEALPLPGPLPDLLYWDVFEPCVDVPEEPVANSLVGDVSDIWRDVTEGLSLYDAGDRGGACSHWKLMHRVHWGEHLVGALRALHLAGR